MDELYYKNFYEQMYKSKKKQLAMDLDEALYLDLIALKELLEDISDENLKAKFERRISMVQVHIANIINKENV